MKRKMPEIGKVYAFFDDGKVGAMRQFTAMVTRILTMEDAMDKKIYGKPLNGKEIEDWVVNHCKGEYWHSLYDYWMAAKYSSNWHENMYQEPIYFIELAIPRYDNHLLYAVPAFDHGWWTFSLYDDWESGELDVEREKIEYYLDDVLKEVLSNQII